MFFIYGLYAHKKVQRKDKWKRRTVSRTKWNKLRARDYLFNVHNSGSPKEWGEIIEGEKSGEIYIIQKFLETVTRKFPNLILNTLWNRDFVFITPQIEGDKKLDNDDMERIYGFVMNKMNDELRSRE
jgi:hypothetical protein